MSTLHGIASSLDWLAPAGKLYNGQTLSTPTKLNFGVSFDVAAISLSDTHACVLGLDGSLLCFGNNNRGQLGVSTTATADAPSTAPVKPLLASGDPAHAAAVSAGNGYTVSSLFTAL